MDTILGLLGLVGIVAGVAVFVWWFDRKTGGGPDIDNTGPGGWGAM